MYIGLSDMRAAFAMLYQLLRCWSSIETALSEFHMSARVLALMPPQRRFPTLES